MPANYKIRPKPKARSKKIAREIVSAAASLELEEPSASYFVRNRTVPDFFGQSLTKGERSPVDLSASSSEPRLFYSHPHGEIWRGDSIEWLRSLETGSVNLVFAYPPYNIKKAEWDTFESQQEYVSWSVRW